MKLSIAVPTYNRADILEVWLQKHAAMLDKAGVDLYISDNCSNDTTAKVVAEWAKHHQNIHYSSTSDTIKAEHNFERCVNLPDDGWVWMVGDSYEITEDALIDVIAALDSKLDFLVVNLQGRVNFTSQAPITANEAVAELSGILSCISCVVYNRDSLGDIKYFAKDTSFYPHMLSVLERIQKTSSKAKWLGDTSVQMIRFETPRKNWANTTRVYEIAVDAWIAAIDSIDDISSASRSKGYKQFGITSGLFKFTGLLWLRAQGLFGGKEYENYSNRLALVSVCPRFIIKLISLFPICILRYTFRFLGKNID